jgi:hypothetical protein
MLSKAGLMSDYKKTGRVEERERTKLGLCRFRPITKYTFGL